MFLVRKSRPIEALSRFSAAGFTCLAALGLVACSSSDDLPAGAGGTGVTGGSSTATAGSAVGAGGAGQQPLGGNSAVAGGSPTSGGASGSASGSAPTGGGVAQAGSGSGGETHVRDHCVEGYEPDPSDATMMDGP